ncbi:MAG: hypothetical protein QOI93_5580 [Rhodospirillaceae bacterium]|nr:hypothetical protein [Rhodospirillaceae bacterium]
MAPVEYQGNGAKVAIVLPDVDPKQIAEGLFWGAFINNGQTCAALKRLYVHDNIYADVCDSLAAYAGKIPVGDGLDEKNVLGPITIPQDVLDRFAPTALPRSSSLTSRSAARPTIVLNSSRC